MRRFTVDQSMSGKKVVRICTTQYPMLKPNQIQKALRQKDVRVNGKRIRTDTTVFEGDSIELWIPEKMFELGEEVTKKSIHSSYKTVFENDHVLIINKSQGVAVHPGKGQNENTLIHLIRSQTKNNHIQLCHRIDMNTGGIVILTKTPEGLKHMQKMFKDEKIIKRYRCLVRGVPDIGTPCICQDEIIMKEITARLEKQSTQKIVIHNNESGLGKPIITRYRILDTYSGLGPDNEDISEVEVELVTGRTHQIRAHFSHINHPILGDGKYGYNSYNKHFINRDGKRIKYQQLFATTVIFGQISPSNIHRSLSKRTFSVIPRYEINL